MGETATKRTAIIIGGSLGGLFAGTMLRRQGWSVDIFERSPGSLDSRGGGIVLQPDVVRLLDRAGVALETLDLGVMSRDRIVLLPDGTVRSRQHAPQTQTSWSLLYTTMRRAFGEEGYHQNRRLAGLDAAKPDDVTALFDDGSTRSANLMVGADGGNSTVRSLLWPDAAPRYAGYVAWRGLIPESDLPPISRAALLGDFAFASNERSHVLGYLVPGEHNDTRPGRRIYNWVWYRAIDPANLSAVMTDVDGRFRGSSVPEGLLAPEWREKIRSEAGALLPPAFRDVVRATKEPFVQAIQDLTVTSMVKGRTILLGDAAFIPRPHTAASTSKAAANAMALADALEIERDDVTRALARWEPGQLQLGNRLYEAGTSAGDYLIFDRQPMLRFA